MSSPKRVLFVGRTAAHFSYYQSVLAALLARGAVVELLLDRGWSKGVAEPHAHPPIAGFLARHPALKVGWLTPRADAWRKPLFALRELRSYRSYLVREATTGFYRERWARYLPQKLKGFTRAPLQGLLKTSAFDAMLRAFENVVPADANITRLLQERRPDVVIASPLNLRYSEETDYIKAAQRLGIPTMMLTLTWDNLSTKGLIQIVPDRVLVWNAQHEADALAIHRVSPDRLTLVGSPFFDKWFDTPPVNEAREAFCGRVGLDPRKRILLYLGSSKNVAPNESGFVRDVHAQLAPRGWQILARPHPAHWQVYEHLGDTIAVWPKRGALPETEQAFAELRGTFHHADATLGINTSAMIDAVLADKPSFSVLLPDHADTQQDALHFQHLRAANAIAITPDIDALSAALDRLTQGADETAAARKAFAQSFARPRGRAAGDAAAEEIQAFADARKRG